MDHENFDASDPKFNAIMTNQAISAQRMAGLMDQNNPMMKAATTQAKQQANAGGRLNSSMTDSAALMAMIEKGAPFAQQDAALYGQGHLAELDQQNASGLMTQTAQYNRQDLGNQARITGALNEQAFENTAAQTGWENEIAKDYTTFSHPYTKELAKMGYDSAERIANTNKAATLGSATINQQTSLATTMGTTMASILNNSTITDKVSSRDSLFAAMQGALSW
jgi:hypothetical protein